jgi:peptide/nickel transport system permease protein
MFINLIKLFPGFYKRNPLGGISFILVIFLIFMAVFANFLSPFSETQGDYAYMAGSPTIHHWFGTDHIGRDILTRIIMGAQRSLTVALVSVIVGTSTGSMLGIIGAYMGGKVDMIIQRILEILQSFPDLILALLLLASFKPSLWTVVFAISITRVPLSGRVLRSAALTISKMDYILAAKSLGASNTRIILQHVTPQCFAPFMVLATAHLGVAILIESSLGFLGAGVPAPAATWGNMLAQAAAGSFIPAWWMVLFPGAAITITVLAFNLLGDALRDELDPRLKGRGL